jgi:hypothetical protein
MKLLAKAAILIFICVLVALAGCAKKDYSEYKEQGFSQDILAEKNSSIDKQTNFTELKGELEEFKSFSDKLFPMWLDYIDRTSALVDDFNSSTILEEKARCSRILEKNYSEFKADLENVKPPAIATRAHNLAFDAVSYRELFFKKFNENAPIEELNQIENQAYLAEAGFWEEIDKIYKYFDEEIVRFDAGDDNKNIVSK